MSERAELLVEIGTEELPPTALPALEQAFAGSMQRQLAETRLLEGALTSFASPRRLAILGTDIRLRQPPQKIEKRGPPVRIAFDAQGQPTRAATAFAEGFGVSVEALERVATDKGEWLIYRGEAAGRPAAELLPGIVSAALAELPVPKRMRWGSSDVEFVRPVHWVVMLHGGEVVPATILGQQAGRETRGHRFHAPEPLALDAPGEYAERLESDGRVIAAFAARRERVRALTEEAAAALGGTAIIEPAVLDEVTALVEWPVPVSGRFDAEFLRLPDDILIATLQEHQRYFPVRSADNQLMPHFIAMSNLESHSPDIVREGNERVVAPRLADAAFFWDQDRRTPLADRVDALDAVVFQKALGSLRDRSQRIGALAGALAAELGHDPADVTRAAILAKTDLLTAMVGEFPKLQGRIGRYYARLDGENDAVSCALEEQYRPVQAGGPLPATDTGRMLALADRFDLIAGIFAVGKRPTGNKDPYGLRRAALGIVRIVIEDGIDIDLFANIERAVAAQPVDTDDAAGLGHDIHAFVIDRWRAYLLDGHAPGIEAGSVTPEIFEAVRVRAPASLIDFRQRIVALREFMQLAAADQLAAANKRIANILKSTAADSDPVIDPDLFDAAAETALYAALESLADAHAARLADRDYTAALEQLAGLREPVDAFFDDVMVMADDPGLQRNRIALLSRLRRTFLDIADLSLLPAG